MSEIKRRVWLQPGETIICEKDLRRLLLSRDREKDNEAELARGREAVALCEAFEKTRIADERTLSQEAADAHWAARDMLKESVLRWAEDAELPTDKPIDTTRIPKYMKPEDAEREGAK